MPIVQVVDSNFDSEVIKSKQIVLVDFGAPWCGPCRMVAPVIREIAHEYGNIIKVVKVNTDANPCVAADYNIRSIPTLMIFQNGVKVDTVIGAIPKSTLLNTLNKYI
uniref:Thioredoxin n=1 Tax=Dipterosiphonia australica TaxID=2007208 RepID=A0A1Z1MLJ8_9FLOR|nr:thioredoxin [Dipterosiphonia australica]ARW66806.1 thioredoxin [Dipterosiphonia australica]